MGKADADKLNFWTKAEYDSFIRGIDKESRYFVIFEILFWTGCREGEMLALTKAILTLKIIKLVLRKLITERNVGILLQHQNRAIDSSD